MHIRLYPRRLTNLFKVLTGPHNSPRFCRACRPTPCRHSACKRSNAWAFAVCNSRRSWRPSASRRKRRRGGPALRSSPEARCSGSAARGRPAEPTPSHSRAQGRAPCFGLPTKAGGTAQGKSGRSQGGTRPTFLTRYPQARAANGAVQ